MSSVVWTCIGVTDEFHPFCPFATRYAARAALHSKLDGHECIEEVVPGAWPLSQMQLEVLENEIRCVDGTRDE